MIPPELLSQVFLSILLSAVVAGGIYLGLARFFEGAPALAIALGFFTGFSTISGLGGYTFPPKAVQAWFPYVTVAALVLGLAETYWLKNLWLKWGVRLVLLSLFLWRIFQPFINHPFPSRSWTSSQTVLNLAVTTLIVSIFWWGLDALTAGKEVAQEGRTRANAVLPTGLMLIGAGTALSVVLAHSIIMGQLTGVLTSTLGAIAVVAWFNPSAKLPQSTTPLLTMLSVLPWLSIYTTLPLVSVILLAVSPWFLIFFKQKPLLQQSLFRLGLTAIPVGAAIISAWMFS